MQAVGLYQEAQAESPWRTSLMLDRSLGPKGLGQLALRSISAYEYPLRVFSLTIYFSLGNWAYLTPRFPLDQWIQGGAMAWSLEESLAVVNTLEEWEEALKLLAPLERIVVEAKSPQGTVVWTSAQK